MFIIWGKVNRPRNLGWVGEYCNKCGEPRAMRLRSIRLYSHLYFIPTSYMGTIGHELKCASCRKKQAADPSRYPNVTRVQDVDLGRLCEETNPLLSEAMQLGFSADDMIACAEAVDPDPASKLVRMLLATHAGLLARDRRFDLQGGMCLLGTLALGILCGVLLGLGSDVLAAVGFGAFAIAVVTTALVVGHEPKRFVRREVEPRIEAQSAELEATREDWETAIDRLAMLDVQLKGWLPRHRLRTLLDRSLPATPEIEAKPARSDEPATAA
jgi:hypothetical protein